MRMAVTGKHGQVALCLEQLAHGTDVDVILVGRPEMDLNDPGSVLTRLKLARPDIIISAAAFTAVDRAESRRDETFEINAMGAMEVATAASLLDVPIIHLSTDYVFNGRKQGAYVETDDVDPQSVYGMSKLTGELFVHRQTKNHVILRTAWVYSPFGHNFVKTMLRLGTTCSSVRVVADQFGCPTSAFDIAAGIIAMSRQLLASPAPELRGVFHMSGAGNASWADFADFIFDHAVNHRRSPVRVERITTSDYPLPAARPANSLLCCDKLEKHFAIRLPDWKTSATTVIDALLLAQTKELS